MLGLGNILTKGGAVLKFPNDFSFNFDGSNDYLDISHSISSFTSDTNATISAWIYPSNTSNYKAIFTFGDTNGNTFIHFQLTDAEILTCGVRSGGSDKWVLNTDSAIQTGVWTHVAVTQNGTSPILYVNGEAVAQTFSVTTDKTFWLNSLSGIDNAHIGFSSYNNNLVSYFDGLIDEVAVWNTDLSASDVAKIASKPVDLSKPSKYATDRTGNLKLWLRAGDKAEPESTTAIARQDFYTDFDGGDDFVDLGSITSANPLSLNGSHGSITCWINIPDVSAGDDFKRIIDKSDGASASKGYSIVVRTDGSINTYIAGSGIITSDAGEITDAEWFHIVWKWDGTNHKLYKNGIEIKSASSSTTPPSDTANTRIGSWNHSTGREFQGAISNLSVYQTALDAQTISQMASDGRFKPQRDNRFSVVDFDGSNDHIVLSSSALYSTHTFSIWINPTDNTSTGVNTFLLFKNDSDNFVQMWHTGTGNSAGKNHIMYRVKANGVQSNNQYNTEEYADEWIHIVGVSSSSGTKLYINGIEKVSNSTDVTNFQSGSTNNYFIGNSSSTLEGSISSVAVYNVAKTAEEVYAIYQQGITYDESSLSGLVGYWRMGDDTSKAYPTIADSSSNSNDGTITNGASNDIQQQAVAMYDMGAFESSSEELGANLVTNSTFDTDITGWSLNSADDNVSISQATVDGKICLDINDQSSNRRNARFDLGDNAEDGELYKISYYARKSQADSSTKDFIVGLGLSNVGGDALNVDKTVAEYDTWEFQEIHVICGSANNYVQFLPTAYNNTATGRLFLDDVKVQKVLQSEVSDSYPAIIDVNEPVLGVNLWDNDYSSGIGSWDGVLNNTVTNDSGAIKITYVDHQAGAVIFLRDSDDLSSDLTVGKIYKLTFKAKVNTGSVTFRVSATSAYDLAITETDFTSKTIYFIATSTNGNFIEQQGMSSGEIIFLKDFALKEVQGNVGTMTNQATSDLVYSSVLPDQSFLAGVNSAYNFIDLDGSNESINLDSFGFALDDYSTGAYSIWFYAQDQNPSSAQYIVSARDGENNTRVYVQLASSGLRIAHGDTFGSYVSYSANQWNHILVSWSSGTVTSYLNGSQAHQFSFSTASGSNLFDFQLGGIYTAGSNFFDGYLGQFALWSKAQDSNVSNINTLGRHGNLLDSYADNLKIYLGISALDAKTGLSDSTSTIYDRSGNSNHVTTTNTESADLKSSPNAEPNGYAKGDTNRSTTIP